MGVTPRNFCHHWRRTILDIPETRDDFWRFFQQHWGPRLAARQSRVALFNSRQRPPA